MHGFLWPLTQYARVCKCTSSFLAACFGRHWLLQACYNRTVTELSAAQWEVFVATARVDCAVSAPSQTQQTEANSGFWLCMLQWIILLLQESLLASLRPCVPALPCTCERWCAKARCDPVWCTQPTKQARGLLNSPHNFRRRLVSADLGCSQATPDLVVLVSWPVQERALKWPLMLATAG